MRNEMRGLELCGVAVVVLLAGCDHPTAIPPIPTPPARPTMTIADAAHGVGHPHFYFLPPLVPNPSFSGTFDPTLGPLLAVDVCRVDAGACVTPLIASFTSSGGATSASVRLDAAAEWYSVNWNTKAAALDPSQTYRIRVSVAGLTIGYADVDVVESGSELKNVQTGEFVGLLDGRTLPIKFRIERDPAIIAHVLHSQNYTAGQVAIVLQRDFGLGAQASATILFGESYVGVDVGQALKDVFNVASGDAALILKTAGFDVAGVGAALQSVYQHTSAQAAGLLKFVGFTVNEVTDALSTVFHEPATALAQILKNVGFPAEEVARGLHMELQLTLRDVAQILKDVGFDATPIARAVHIEFQLVGQAVAQILKAGGVSSRGQGRRSAAQGRRLRPERDRAWSASGVSTRGTGGRPNSERPPVQPRGNRASSERGIPPAGG